MNELLETFASIRNLIKNAGEFDIIEDPKKINAMRESIYATIEMMELCLEINAHAFPDVEESVRGNITILSSLVKELDEIADEYAQSILGAAA